jgi:hypothetical protein
MKLKIGTRVIVEGEETFISELHQDITRGVYRVRTSNPTYEFCKRPKGKGFVAFKSTGEFIELSKADKTSKYQQGDRVFDSSVGVGVITRIIPDIMNDYPIEVDFKGTIEYYTICGRSSDCNNTPDLKRLRVKL